MLAAIRRNEGNKSAAARELGVNRNTLYALERSQLAVAQGRLPDTAKSLGRRERISWDNDTRVISVSRFQEFIGIVLSTKVRDRFKPIIEEAQRGQLNGEVYPAPDYDEFLERKYMRVVSPVVRDDDGNAVLWPHDALFITLKYQFSSHRRTIEDDVSLITDKDFSRWFSGESRSHGTGKHDDSCFSRLGVIDPNTGEIAKFTSHDVRHWLNTSYAKGGMSEQLIALIFNRKPENNHVYDQTSMKSRVKSLRKAIEKRQVYGHIADTYNRLADESRDEAEKYLKASVLMATLMPHGLCSLNWMMTPCPHSLACFSAHGHEGENPCEYLHIELDDERQVAELQRIKEETEATLEVLPEQSPQYHHFAVVKRNIDTILARCSSCRGEKSCCKGES